MYKTLQPASPTAVLDLGVRCRGLIASQVKQYHSSLLTPEEVNFHLSFTNLLNYLRLGNNNSIISRKAIM